MRAAAEAHDPPGVAPFPWRTAMHAGLFQLRLSPEIFWALTPSEFAAMTGQFGGREAAPRRRDLQAMMALYPDTI